MARTAIVTGAESGIGRATAAVLAERGWDVGIAYHDDRAEAEETAAEVRGHGRRAELGALDLARPAEAAAAVDALAAALGGLDAMVNVAGVMHIAPFLETRLEDWRRVVDIDLTGTFACAQAAARRMVAQGRGGRIVNVTSVHEHVPLRGAAAYCAAKGGLGLLTKVMALELAEHGITVNAVAPGEIATAMTGADERDPSEIPRPHVPVGRPGAAREVAHLVAALAATEASYITGASLAVDGGLLLMAAIANQDDGGEG